MEISAIHLVRIGDKVIVKAEIGRRWVQLMEEHVDGAFSHIIEEGGMEREMLKLRRIE